MSRRMTVLVAVATPVVAVITWFFAYGRAVAVMPGSNCCENGMNMAPIPIILLGVPGLVIAGLVGVGATSQPVSSVWRSVFTAITLGITALVGLFMFAMPPLTLTPDKTQFGDYWPVTSETVPSLVLGFVLTVLPWLGALAICVVRYVPTRSTRRTGVDASSGQATPPLRRL